LTDASGAELARLRLVRAVAADGEGNRWEPGEITTSGDVQCGDEAISILELQPDGGKPMAMSDYRRGHQWQAGLRLGAVE
jgi:methionyl-tRNA formyltransferase